MTDTVIPLYPYRVHTSGGHVHVVYVPYACAKDFWKALKSLAEKDECLETHSVKTSNGDTYDVIIRASSITVIDAPLGRVTIVLSEVKDKLKVERTKNAVKKAKANAKQLGESTAKARNSAKKRIL